MSVHASGVKLGSEAATALDALEASTEPAARSIVRRIHALRDILLANCLHGEVIKKGQIPAHFASEYGAQNLYVEELPSFWRLLYTIVADERRRYVIILAIVDHGRYDTWFSARRR